MRHRARTIGSGSGFVCGWVSSENIAKAKAEYLSFGIIGLKDQGSFRFRAAGGKRRFQMIPMLGMASLKVKFIQLAFCINSKLYFFGHSSGSVEMGGDDNSSRNPKHLFGFIATKTFSLKPKVSRFRHARKLGNESCISRADGDGVCAHA